MSKGEDLLEFQFKAVLGLKPYREYEFHPDRKWRFDFALTDWKMAFEVEGGTWSKKSRHTTGSGYEEDCIKYNEATRLGWQVYRFTTGQVKNGQAIKFIEQVVNLQNGN